METQKHRTLDYPSQYTNDSLQWEVAVSAVMSVLVRKTISTRPITSLCFPFRKLEYSGAVLSPIAGCFKVSFYFQLSCTQVCVGEEERGEALRRGR